MFIIIKYFKKYFFLKIASPLFPSVLDRRVIMNMAVKNIVKFIGSKRRLETNTII